jgi:hypothetical protein
MCTRIAMNAPITGGGKGPKDWFPVTMVSVGYDHTAFYVQDEHALLLDFLNPSLGPTARVALEMDVESGRALIAQLQAAIAAAEEAGVVE